MHRKTRLKLTELNPLLTCSLCTGYLIDATTLTECLHSFCRSCLVRYLHTSQHCPKCDTLVHKTRPLLNARVDRVLQNVVYKLVPGLFKDEMKKRREFYTKNPQAGTSSEGTSPADLEARGEVSEEALVIYSDDEFMHLSLEYYVPYRRKILEEKNEADTEKSKKRTNGDSTEDDDIVHKRYLRCPAAVSVKHIKKFIRNKFDLKPNYEIEITHMDNEDDSLPDDYTLMDVAYIYTWRRNGPLPLVFRVFQEANKRQKTNHITDNIPANLQTTSVDSVKPDSDPKLPSSDNSVPVSKDSTPPTADAERLPEAVSSSVEPVNTPSLATTYKAASPKPLHTEIEKLPSEESNQSREFNKKKTTESESLPDFMCIGKDDTDGTTLNGHKDTPQKGLLHSDDIGKDNGCSPSLLNNNDKQEIVKDDRPNIKGGISIHLQAADMTSSLDAAPATLTAPVSVR